MSESYSGKVCVVTGAAAGIGRALVLALLAEKARVFALDCHPGRLESLRAEEAGSGTLTLMKVDVVDRQEMESAAQRILAEAGAVDLLINNAGVTHLEETVGVSFATWRRVLDVNYLGALHGIFCFYPAMVKRGAGHVVNIASIAGSSGYTTAQAYATSKAAVIGFSRSLEVEARTHGVTVTCVCPSYVDTKIFEDSLNEGWSPKQVRETFMTSPLSPEKAAEFIMAGIRKGRRTVVFPFSGRVLYWLSRWCPWALGLVQKILLKKFRAARPDANR